MRSAIVTGSGGLIGSEAARYFTSQGFDVTGIDNDMRSYFFGSTASTRVETERLERELPTFRALEIDIRDERAVERVFARTKPELVIHCAAQPSHDWAAREPHTDFSINAVGTFNLLEAARRHSPDYPFVFASTNKVYGDRPNQLPLVELETRWELPDQHQWFNGIPTRMSIDRCTHSLFGASKLSADILVQEYGRYFEMPTVSFRGGCLTGPQHAGAQLHGFLAYLMRCTVAGEQYTVYGYKGKQVRDNIHAYDVVRAFHEFALKPSAGAVYNIGGGRVSNVSMLEAINKCEEISGRRLSYEVLDSARLGDHQWYISDLTAFSTDYPNWSITYDIDDILTDIYQHNVDDWGR